MISKQNLLLMKTAGIRDRVFTSLPKFRQYLFTTVELPSPSELTVNYTASVSEDAVQELQEALQKQYDALNGEPGSFTVSLGNTADFGGTESSGNVNIGGTIAAPPAPGVPNLGESFGKSVDPTSVNIETEDDELIDPVDVTYTFKADLTQWNLMKKRTRRLDFGSKRGHSRYVAFAT